MGGNSGGVINNHGRRKKDDEDWAEFAKRGFFVTKKSLHQKPTKTIEVQLFINHSLISKNSHKLTFASP